MAKFCKFCGSPIDEKTGLCPKCNAVKEAEKSETVTQQVAVEAVKKSKAPVIAIIVTVSCLVIAGAITALGFSGVFSNLFGGNKEIETAPTTVVDVTSIVETTTEVVETTAASVNTQALTPEEAVEIFVNNKSVWLQDIDYANIEGYGFLDLDFDGNLELVYGNLMGTGFFTYASVYKIDTKDNSVYEVSNPLNENSSMYDIFSEELKLVKDKDTGELKYYASDFMRNGWAENATSYGLFYMKNDEIVSEKKFSEITSTSEAENGEYVEEKTYKCFENGTWLEVNETEYNLKKNAFEKDNKNMYLRWSYVNADEAEKANSKELYNRLLDVYTAFSYDGFAFEGYQVAQ